MTNWQKFDTAPTNRRILIVQDGPPPNDELAIAWLDRIDGLLYYAPQMGLVPWVPTHWDDIPAGPGACGEKGQSR